MGLVWVFPLSDWAKNLIMRTFYCACWNAARKNWHFKLLTHHYIAPHTLHSEYIGIWVRKSLLILPLTPNINADVVPEVHGDIASWYTTYNMLFHQLTTSPYRQASQYIFFSKLDETYSTILHKSSLIIMKRLSFHLSLSLELLASRDKKGVVGYFIFWITWEMDGSHTWGLPYFYD